MGHQLLPLLCCVGFLGCAAPGIKSVRQENLSISGTVAIPARLDSNGSRLFVYLKTEEGSTVIGVGLNRTEKRILDQLYRMINGQKPGATIELFVTPLTSGVEEILVGVDFQIHAVKLLDVPTDRYRVVHVDWQKRLDAQSWRSILQQILDKALDKAL